MSKITRFQPYIFILLAAGFLYYWLQGFLYYWCQGFYISDQTIFIFGPKHFLITNKQEKENEKEKR